MKLVNTIKGLQNMNSHETLNPSDFIFQDNPRASYVEFISDCTKRNLNSLFDSEELASYTTNFKYHYNSFNDRSIESNVSKIIKYIDSMVKPQIDNIDSIQNFHSRFLPPGVRYITPGLIVFEKPPTHKLISIFDDYKDTLSHNTRVTDYYLPIPWQVYIASYNPKDMRLYSVKMYFSNSSIYSSNQHIYTPPLHNFFANGKLCRPFFSTMEDIEKYSQDYSGIIASAYDWIWNTGFNLDITQNIAEFIYTTKHQQFKPYLTDPSDHIALHFLDTLSSNSLLPRNLDISYVHRFFSLWEKIPLENIISLKFSNYSPTDYYDNFHELGDELSPYVDEYTAMNDLIIHEYDDHSDYYDEDEGSSYCPDNCISESSLYESHSFNRFLYNKILTSPSTLRDAVNSSVKELSSMRISQYIPTRQHFNNLFFSNFDILVESS